MAILFFPNWGNLQHYKTRLAPWVKLYTATLQHPKYRALPLAARGLLADLSRLAVETGNAIPDDPAWLSYKLGTKTPLAPLLADLLAGGHLESASTSASASLISQVVSSNQAFSHISPLRRGESESSLRANGKAKTAKPEIVPRKVHPAIQERLKRGGK